MGRTAYLQKAQEYFAASAEEKLKSAHVQEPKSLNPAKHCRFQCLPTPINKSVNPKYGQAHPIDTTTGSQYRKDLDSLKANSSYLAEFAEFAQEACFAAE